MRQSLSNWVSDADALRHLDEFAAVDIPSSLAYQRTRREDLYTALTGELFERIRAEYENPADWARLGNAFAQFAARDREDELKKLGIASGEAALFSAAAFYFGGFPASAYLTIRSVPPVIGDDAISACYELLGRPPEIHTAVVKSLLSSLRTGRLDEIASLEADMAGEALSALDAGPDQWISARLLEKLVAKFRGTNLRAVLPQGASEFWTPLVLSFLNEPRPTWDFFPSQIQAIRNGLLERTETYSLQMPTGAGKTTLCETLLFWHLSRSLYDVAVLLVPYRSLAAELRNTLVRRLNKMDISARCAYGGTVPSANENQALENIRALVATPEALSGILSANPSLTDRISLVICDEGHLLDADSRGVGLELLLARMKMRTERPKRFIFVSAIVPNIEEINAWLGGSPDSVVRSDYRPAIADFAVLRSKTGGSTSVALEMHPHEAPPIRFQIENFLRRADFQWQNPLTRRFKTYPFTSVKTRAVVAARKALPMGAAVVFAANKRGNQGALGLAEEYLAQVECNLKLPDPYEYADKSILAEAVDYLANEYGNSWIGTRAFKRGAALHHGDIPQETREVIENMLRDGSVKLAFCTSTLAEGVNLPIRTLVLYSVQRRGAGGVSEDLLTREIKNLVGRAGRPGGSTKGLVICANEKQWHLVQEVARQATGENVVGALRSLIENVRRVLAAQNIVLTNEILERTPPMYALIDGVDSTLIDLAATEIGDDELIRMAKDLAGHTFASQQGTDDSKRTLEDVFALRATRVAQTRASGHLGWIRETGARLRMVNAVQDSLYGSRARWDDIASATDPEFIDILLNWAWKQPELTIAVREGFRLAEEQNLDSVRQPFFMLTTLWISGASFTEIASRAGLSIDDLLGIHAHVVAFTLQTIIEQGIALLEKVVESKGGFCSPHIVQFPEHLRFGVPTVAGKLLALGGIRHRRAFTTLGNASGMNLVKDDDDRSYAFNNAQNLLSYDLDAWTERLGDLVMRNTRKDLSAYTGFTL